MLGINSSAVEIVESVAVNQSPPPSASSSPLTPCIFPQPCVVLPPTAVLHHLFQTDHLKYAFFLFFL